MRFVLVILLAVGTNSRETSIITFPTSFTSFKHGKIDALEVKNCYREGINAVQSLAGILQNLFLEENINFAAKNWIISPISLAGVFAQLLIGSRGPIREILSGALSLNERGDEGKNMTKFEVHRQLGNLIKRIHHPEDEDYALLLNSIVFLQSGYSLKQTYKHALWDFYNTPIFPIDFTGKSFDPIHKINQWVRNATQNRFSDLLTWPVSPNTVSIMASIVYFKGSWEMPFDPEYTQPGLFYISPNEKAHVDYMYGEQEVLYGNTSYYQLIGLPYKSRDVVMYILLPNGKFSSRVAIEQFNAMASSAKLEKITLVLPKVKLTTTISVKDAINTYLRKGTQSSQKYRAEKSKKHKSNYSNEGLSPRHSSSQSHKVDESFDVSDASEDVRFKIDDIVHKVSMQIDEKGTELVAATSTLVDHSGNDFVLKVNRPFLFFIRHEITQAHLFWGIIANPNEDARNTTKT